MTLPKTRDTDIKQPKASLEIGQSLMQTLHSAYLSNSAINQDRVSIFNSFRLKTEELDSFAPKITPDAIILSDLPFDPNNWSAFRPQFKRLEKRFPNASISAFSATDILDFVVKQKSSLTAVIDQLLDLGINTLSGHDFALSDNGWWLEIHEAANSAGMLSEVVIDYQPEHSTDDLSHGLSRLRQLQADYRRITRVFVRAESLDFREQLKVCARVRLGLPKVDDIGVLMTRHTYLAGQIKICFGMNMIAQEQSLSDEPISEHNLKLAVTKSKRRLKSSQSHPLEPQMPRDLIQLFKLDHQEQFSTDDLVQIVEQFPLSAVGMLTKNREPTRISESFILLDCRLEKVDPDTIESHQNLYWDFSNFGPDDLATIDWDYIRQTIKAIDPKFRIVFIGLQGLWQVSHFLKLKVCDTLVFLSELGFNTLSSSEDETEENLTTSEVIDIHSCAHRLDMNTIGKVELSAVYNGESKPFWTPFGQRVIAFSELQKETQKLTGIIVQESKSAFISLYEYLQAIAMSSIAFEKNIDIITPLRTLSQGVLQPKLVTKHSIHELIPLLMLFGSTHSGLLLDGELNDLIQKLDF
ncbi:MAG: hypothetical protein HRU19_17860 [Pseudobacteriovorax sp.]|nr:hypothetical protein [Pseudobacteriovorax sp.]